MSSCGWSRIKYLSQRFNWGDVRLRWPLAMRDLKRELNVCVVGSGVAGLSTAGDLIKKHPDTRVDILEKLPIPFGLIRYGVAPDHMGVKNCAGHLTSIAESENCRFIGNIELGKEIQLSQLQPLYHAIVLASGVQEECKMDIPGENLPGVYSAKAFYSWYNGLPSYRELNPDLSGEVAVVIGHGNVALDVARILLTPTSLLKHTDICDHALKALCNSNIRKVHLVGRHSPLEVTFSTKEIRNMSKLPGCQFTSDPCQFQAIKNMVSALPRSKRRLMELMATVTDVKSSTTKTTSETYKEWNLCFRSTPKEIVLDQLSGKVGSIRMQVNTLEEAKGTSYFDELNCNMVLVGIGFHMSPVEGLPWLETATARAIPNKAGRIIHGTFGSTIPGLYCSGWIKTGPEGGLQNTMTSAYETADSILKDYKQGKLLNPQVKNGLTSDIMELLGPFQVTSFSDWKLIDEREVKLSSFWPRKSKEKIVSFDEMLKIVKSNT